MLLTKEAWHDTHLARTELMALHRKMGHTYFPFLGRQWGLALLHQPTELASLCGRVHVACHHHQTQTM